MATEIAPLNKNNATIRGCVITEECIGFTSHRNMCAHAK